MQSQWTPRIALRHAPFAEHLQGLAFDVFHDSHEQKLSQILRASECMAAFQVPHLDPQAAACSEH
jgi:hypothetical protein